MSKSLLGWPVALAILVFAVSAPAQPAPSGAAADVTLRSTPHIVIWGYFTAGAPPVLRIRSGETVRIDTVLPGRECLRCPSITSRLLATR